MVLPLLGTIAMGAIKGIVGRKRRKKGEGAQVSGSIVKVSKNKGDKKSSSLVKASTPMFGGSKGVSETSSSMQSSSIIESLNKIDESIANIKQIIVSESRFKSKVNADNLKKENLLMKRKKEKEFKSKKTSMSITGKAMSKAGSFLSRFLPFIVATLLGGVVVALYKGLANIIKFFQGIFKALNGFFAALDPFIRPILDFFNLFKKQDVGELDSKIGETEEEEVNKLEGQVKELDEQADVFVKEFNKKKEEFLKVSTQYQKTVEVAVDKINKDILIAQENTFQDTGDIASIDPDEVKFYDDGGNYMGDQMDDSAAGISPDTIATDTITKDTTAADTTTEVTPKVSMVDKDIIPDKSDQGSDVKPTTSLVPKKEEDESSGNNISADKFFIDEKPPTYAGLRELEERTDMNPYKHERKVREYTDSLSLYNKKMYGSNTPITFNGKTYEPGDPNYELVLQMTQAHFRKDLNKRDKLRQMIIKLEDQTFYETNQTKTNVVFVSPNNSPQVASSGKGGGVVVLQEPISISMIDNKLRKTALYKG